MLCQCQAEIRLSHTSDFSHTVSPGFQITNTFSDQINQTVYSKQDGHHLIFNTAKNCILKLLTMYCERCDETRTISLRDSEWDAKTIIVVLLLHEKD